MKAGGGLLWRAASAVAAAAAAPLALEALVRAPILGAVTVGIPVDFPPTEMLPAFNTFTGRNIDVAADPNARIARVNIADKSDQIRITQRHIRQRPQHPRDRCRKPGRTA